VQNQHHYHLVLPAAQVKVALQCLGMLPQSSADAEVELELYSDSDNTSPGKVTCRMNERQQLELRLKDPPERTIYLDKELLPIIQHFLESEYP
jgi:hypothetical protein